MLRLLELVAEGGVHTYGDLARELGVGEALLRPMIEELAQRGYLRAVADGCGTQCAGCPLGNACALGGPARVWMLTEKGTGQDVTE